VGHRIRLAIAVRGWSSTLSISNPIWLPAAILKKTDMTS